MMKTHQIKNTEEPHAESSKLLKVKNVAYEHDTGNIWRTTAKVTSWSRPSFELYDLGIHSISDLICYYARVSNPSNEFNTLTAPKLLAYLIRNNHWSPLEMVNVDIEVLTTRDISHQLIRHRSFCFQEFSQRYSNISELEGFVVPEVRLQDHKNRQNSVYTNDEELYSRFQEKATELAEQAKITYDWAVRVGIANETARKILPEGMTKTRVHISGNCRSWWHYIALRGANGTQREHMEVARACMLALEPLFPEITKSIESAGD